MLIDDLAAGQAVGRPLIDAANRAGVPVAADPKRAALALYRGARLLTPKRTEMRLATGEALFAGKLAPLNSASVVVEDWRRAGLRVGFTNGCFDLLHSGHIALLAAARKLCDRLVVGLNADDSIRRLKGAERPIQSEPARAEVIGALCSVDLVVLFPEDTPLALIKALLPDVLVKGADYTVEAVVGADLVPGWGGRVALVDLAPDQSSSRLIAKSRLSAVGGAAK